MNPATRLRKLAAAPPTISPQGLTPGIATQMPNAAAGIGPPQARPLVGAQPGDPSMNPGPPATTGNTTSPDPMGPMGTPTQPTGQAAQATTTQPAPPPPDQQQAAPPPAPGSFKPSPLVSMYADNPLVATYSKFVPPSPPPDATKSGSVGWLDDLVHCSSVVKRAMDGPMTAPKPKKPKKPAVSAPKPASRPMAVKQAAMVGSLVSGAEQAVHTLARRGFLVSWAEQAVKMGKLASTTDPHGLLTSGNLGNSLFLASRRQKRAMFNLSSPGLPSSGMGQGSAGFNGSAFNSHNPMSDPSQLSRLRQASSGARTTFDIAQSPMSSAGRHEQLGPLFQLAATGDNHAYSQLVTTLKQLESSGGDPVELQHAQQQLRQLEASNPHLTKISCAMELGGEAGVMSKNLLVKQGFDPLAGMGQDNKLRQAGKAVGQIGSAMGTAIGDRYKQQFRQNDQLKAEKGQEAERAAWNAPGNKQRYKQQGQDYKKWQAGGQQGDRPMIEGQDTMNQQHKGLYNPNKTPGYTQNSNQAVRDPANPNAARTSLYQAYGMTPPPAGNTGRVMSTPPPSSGPVQRPPKPEEQPPSQNKPTQYDQAGNIVGAAPLQGGQAGATKPGAPAQAAASPYGTLNNPYGAGSAQPPQPNAQESGQMTGGTSGGNAQPGAFGAAPFNRSYPVTGHKLPSNLGANIGQGSPLTPGATATHNIAWGPNSDGSPNTPQNVPGGRSTVPPQSTFTQPGAKPAAPQQAAAPAAAPAPSQPTGVAAEAAAAGVPQAGQGQSNSLVAGRPDAGGAKPPANKSTTPIVASAAPNPGAGAGKTPYSKD